MWKIFFSLFFILFISLFVVAYAFSDLTYDSQKMFSSRTNEGSAERILSFSSNAFQALSCVSCNIQNPIIIPSSPKENTKFTVICPAGPNANPIGACRGSSSPKWCNGITAKVDNRQCATFNGWTDQGASFVCDGLPAGTHTVICEVAANQDCWPDGIPKTCGESSQYSFVIQASQEGKFDHYLSIRVTDVNTGQSIYMSMPDYMGGSRCSSNKIQVNSGDQIKIDWIFYKIDGTQEAGNPSIKLDNGNCGASGGGFLQNVQGASGLVVLDANDLKNHMNSLGGQTLFMHYKPNLSGGPEGTSAEVYLQFVGGTTSSSTSSSTTSSSTTSSSTSSSTTSSSTTSPSPETPGIVFVPLSNFLPFPDSDVQRLVKSQLDYFRKISPSSCNSLEPVVIMPTGECTDCYGPCCMNEALDCAVKNGYGNAKRIVGVMGPRFTPPDLFMYGCGEQPGQVAAIDVAAVDYPGGGDWVLSHELGHTFGLCHMKGDSACPDPADACQGDCFDPVTGKSAGIPNIADCSRPDNLRKTDVMTYCIGNNKLYGSAAFNYIDQKCANQIYDSSAPHDISLAYLTFYKDGRITLNSLTNSKGFIDRTQGDYTVDITSGGNLLYTDNFNAQLSAHLDKFYPDGSIEDVPINLDYINVILKLPELEKRSNVQIKSLQRPIFSIMICNVDKQTNQIAAISAQECHQNEECVVQTTGCSDILNLFVNLDNNILSPPIVVTDQTKASFVPHDVGKFRLISFCFGEEKMTVSSNDFEVT